MITDIFPKTENAAIGLKKIYLKITEIIQYLNSSASSSPKKYVALLTQDGTDAPVATILENTLSGVPEWSRGSEGNYKLTLDGEFVDGKVKLSTYDLGSSAVPITSDTEILGYYLLYSQASTADYISLDVVDESFVRADLGAIIGEGRIAIEIVVYS